MEVPWEGPLFPLPSATAVLGLPQVNRGGKMHREDTLSRKSGFMKRSDPGGIWAKGNSGLG